MREDLPPRKKFGSNLKPVQTRQGNTEGSKKDIWLTRAKDAFDISTSYVDTNYRKDWEDSIRHFQGRHMAGSKYYSESYKHRSKMFRPKTRSTVRQVEAATAAAFFSQLDVITVEAEDEHDHMSMAGSALRQELLNYRLSGKKQIPWYQICVGAMQEAEIYGIVISKQYWDFREREVEMTLSQDDMSILDQEGNPAKIKQTVTIMDQPDIKLYPIENIRFDPAAEWTNVVETSPYFINYCSRPETAISIPLAQHVRTTRKTTKTQGIAVLSLTSTWCGCMRTSCISTARICSITPWAVLLP